MCRPGPAGREAIVLAARLFVLMGTPVLCACAGSSTESRPSQAGVPDQVSITGGPGSPILVVRPTSTWRRPGQIEIVPFDLTPEHVIVKARVWGTAEREPCTVCFTLDSGARLGASLSERSARSIRLSIAPGDAGRSPRMWTVFENPPARVGVLSAVEVGHWKQSPVWTEVRQPDSSPGPDVLGLLWMKEAAAIGFDWVGRRLLMVPRGSTEPDGEPTAWWEMPGAGHWIRVPMVPQVSRVYSPPFHSKQDAARWLEQQGDPDPQNSLAGFPEHSERPVSAFTETLVDDPLPCVSIELGGERRVALVDLGHSGDLGWFGAAPPREAVALEPPEYIEVRARDARGVVERSLLSAPVRLDGVEFDGLRVDRVSGVSPDTSRFGFQATLGLGALRRQPLIIDFERNCLWFWLANSRD